MTKKDFLDQHKEVLDKYANRIIEGNMDSFDDIDKAAFNGVYVICSPEGEVLYIGSAYTSSFRINRRLRGHRYGHVSNATLVNDLMAKNGWTREEAKEYVKSCSFIAIEHLPLEYYLIENTPGLLNKKGFVNF